MDHLPPSWGVSTPGILAPALSVQVRPLALSGKRVLAHPESAGGPEGLQPQASPQESPPRLGASQSRSWTCGITVGLGKGCGLGALTPETWVFQWGRDHRMEAHALGTYTATIITLSHFPDGETEAQRAARVCPSDARRDGFEPRTPKPSVPS